MGGTLHHHHRDVDDCDLEEAGLSKRMSRCGPKGRGREIEVKDPTKSRIQENLDPLRAISMR